MPNQRGQRLASERVAPAHEPEAQDSSERQQLRQWLEDIRNSSSSAPWWLPVIKVAFALAVVFICLALFDPTG